MYRLVILVLLPFQSWCQQAFIELNGGEKHYSSSVTIVREKFEKPYLKTAEGTIFQVTQVASFQCEEGFFIKNTLTKNPDDFAQRVINGRVQVFRYDFNADYLQMGQNNTRDYYAYQKYEQPLKQMIYQNLSKDLADNSESMRVLRRVQRAKKIAPLYYVLGSATLISAFVVFNTDQDELATPLFLSGVGFFAVPWVLNSRRQKRMDDAVRIYNAG